MGNITFRIDYDDSALDVIDYINRALASADIKFKFESDGKEHDGFEIIELKEKK